MKLFLTNKICLLLKVRIKLYVFRQNYIWKYHIFQIKKQASDMLFVAIDNFCRISESMNPWLPKYMTVSNFISPYFKEVPIKQFCLYHSKYCKLWETVLLKKLVCTSYSSIALRSTGGWRPAHISQPSLPAVFHYDSNIGVTDKRFVFKARGRANPHFPSASGTSGSCSSTGGG